MVEGLATWPQCSRRWPVGSWPRRRRARLGRGREPGLRLAEPLLGAVAVGARPERRARTARASRRRPRGPGAPPGRRPCPTGRGRSWGRWRALGRTPRARRRVMAREGEDHAEVGDGVDVPGLAPEDGGVGGDRLLVAAGVEARVSRLQHALQHLLRDAGGAGRRRRIPVPCPGACRAGAAAMPGSGRRRRRVARDQEAEDDAEHEKRRRPSRRAPTGCRVQGVATLRRRRRGRRAGGSLAGPSASSRRSTATASPSYRAWRSR